MKLVGKLVAAARYGEQGSVKPRVQNPCSEKGKETVNFAKSNEINVTAPRRQAEGLLADAQLRNERQHRWFCSG